MLSVWPSLVIRQIDLIKEHKLVLHLLQFLETSRQQDHDIVEPVDGAALQQVLIRLIRLHNIDGKDQLEALDVKAEHQLVRDQRKDLHVFLGLQLNNTPFLREYKHIPSLIEQLNHVIKMQYNLVQRFECQALHVQQNRLQNIRAVRYLVQIPGAFLL